MFEKRLLRDVAKKVANELGVPSGFLVRAPHVTLVYSFRPRVEPLELFRVVARAAGYDGTPPLCNGMVLARRRHGSGLRFGPQR